MSTAFRLIIYGTSTDGDIPYVATVLKDVLQNNGSELVTFDADSIVVTLQQPPLESTLNDEADLRIIHNALTRYHTILTQEHASYPTEANQLYRNHVQALADTTRDQIATLQQPAKLETIEDAVDFFKSAGMNVIGFDENGPFKL